MPSGTTPSTWEDTIPEHGLERSKYMRTRHSRFFTRIELVEQLQQFSPPPTGPRVQCQALQLLAAYSAPQFRFSAEPLTHGQAVKLIHHRRSIANQLVSMPQELAHVAVGWGWPPNLRESVREE